MSASSIPAGWICTLCKARLGLSDRTNITNLSRTWLRRGLSNSSHLHKPSVEPTLNTPDLDLEVLSFNREQFGDRGDVRQYLRDWSVRQQQWKKDHGPENVVPGRNTVIPNSMFVRDDAVSQTEHNPIEDRASEEEHTIDQTKEDEDLSSMTILKNPLQPGDAFKMTRNTQVRPQLAVYLGSIGVQAQFLLEDGQWFMDTQIVYDHHKIPGFMSREEITRVRSYLPVKLIEVSRTEDGGASALLHAFGEVPFDACAAVLRRFQKLKSEAEMFRRDYTDAIESAWEGLADQKTFREITMEDFVSQYLNLDYNALSDGARLELLDILIANEKLNAMRARASYVIVVMPKMFNAAVDQVTKWARSYQDAAAQAALGKDVSHELKSNPIVPFITRCRRLISKSRKLRSPTSVGLLSPTLSEIGRKEKSALVELLPTNEEFSEQDKVIVTFLWLSYLKTPRGFATRTRRNDATAALILRAIGAYPKMALDRVVGRVFLQEIGCLPPWLQDYDHNVRLPLPVLGLNQRVLQLRERRASYLNELRLSGEHDFPPDQADGFDREGEVVDKSEGTNIYFPDTMADLRQDLGDLPVFCIDKASTSLIDDGISLERAAQDGQYWLHIHIAHGSAHIPRESPIIEYAQYAVVNLYTSNGLHSCIPRCVTMPLSIKAGSSTMTVSTRIDEKGVVYETKIFPSKVNNIVRIQPTYLHNRFPIEQNPMKYEFRVGHSPDMEQIGASKMGDNDAATQQELVNKHYDTFAKIRDLLAARWTQRQIEYPDYLTGSIFGQNAAGHVITGRGGLIEAADGSFDRLMKPRHYRGDPGIYMWIEAPTVNVTYDNQPAKRDIVSGCMLMVCESVGRWCSERNVPVIYNTHYFNREFPMAKLKQLQPQDPRVPPSQAESIEPARHYLLNCDQYVRLTSPLRRWKDLMFQYQIDSFLRAEATAKTAAGDRKIAEVAPVYPYSKKDIQSYMEGETAYALLAMFKRAERDHWRFMALFRAFYFKEAKLPDVWEVQHMPQVHLGRHDNVLNHYYAYLAPFSWMADLMKTPEGYEKMAQNRDYQRVVIDHIDMDRMLVFVKAIAPPTKEPTLGRHPVFTPKEDAVPPESVDTSKSGLESSEVHT